MTQRTIIVTGGATGIGLATAKLFADAGDHVVIAGRRARALYAAVGTLGAQASALPFDASDPDAVQRALQHLPTGIDVLVNNAGGNTDRARQPPAPGDLAAVVASWRANLDANLLSAVLVTTALIPRLRAGGRVVNLSSIAARRGAGSYGASKAAVEAWTADLATALGPRAITANAVAPGLTLDTEFFAGTLTEQRRQQLVAETRTGRAGTPEDVAATVAFLASPQAGHITGQVIHVNGGAYLGR